MIKSLGPVLQGLAALAAILTFIGGFNMFGDSSKKITSKPTEKIKPKEITQQTNSGSNISSENNSNGKSDNKNSTKTRVSSSQENDNNEKIPESKKGLFSHHSKKESSKKNLSFFILKNGIIDHKTTRSVSSILKQNGINTPFLFDNSLMSQFNNFISPSISFLQKHKLLDYTDAYFICDISTLKTTKTPGRESFTSALNIEGYLIKVNNGNAIVFPYNNIKGAAFSANDAEINLNEDLKEKITDFIKINLNQGIL